MMGFVVLTIGIGAFVVVLRDLRCHKVYEMNVIYTRQYMSFLADGVKNYKKVYDYWPEALSCLLPANNPKGMIFVTDEHFYLDAWGFRLQYRAPDDEAGTQGQVISWGADGRRGGDGRDRDLYLA
jgi:hypothetical protein